MAAIENHPYQIALVALDLTKMDEHVIRYASLISKILPLERIYFLHVAKELELPADLLTKYPKLMAPLDESMQSDIEQNVSKHFDNSNIAVECVVKEGAPIERLLKFAKVKEVDLIMMGRKKSLDGSGLVSSHIARKCPSSLLLIPEDNNRKMDKVLVPVDFSSHSALALKQATTLVKDVSRQIELIHIYDVPKGYTKIGKTYDEFSEIIKGHHQKDCSRFLKENDLPADLKCTYFAADQGDREELIHNYGKECGADIILIGSRGRTITSSILMGSLAEKLVFRESHLPVLVVKKRGENMGFIETLLKI